MPYFSDAQMNHIDIGEAMDDMFDALPWQEWNRPQQI